VRAAGGRWAYEPPPGEELEPAEALPVETRPLLTVAAAHERFAEEGAVFFLRAGPDDPVARPLPPSILASDARVEAAAWLRSSTFVSLGLPGLEALMLEGVVDARCAATATCDLFEALCIPGAGRTDDAVRFAEAVLAEDWPLRSDKSREAQLELQVLLAGRQHTLNKHKRWELRGNLGDKSSGFEAPEWPLGRGLPMFPVDVLQMYRSAALVLARAAKGGHPAALATLVGLTDRCGAEDTGSPLVTTVLDLAGLILSAVPDDHEKLIPAALNMIRAQPVASLRRLCRQERAALSTPVAEAVRDLIVSLTPPQPTGFTLLVQKEGSWFSDPRLVAKAQASGCAVEELLPVLTVELVDACGFLADEAAGRFWRVSNETPVARRVLSDWGLIAPPLVAMLLNGLSQAPALKENEDVLIALCSLSRSGPVESRRLALEALGLLAPKGHASTLQAACDSSLAEDAAAREQALELLAAVARPEDVPSLRERLAATCSVYAGAPSQALASCL